MFFVRTIKRIIYMYIRNLNLKNSNLPCAVRRSGMGLWYAYIIYINCVHYYP
jgi:hypothetical protein